MGSSTSLCHAALVELWLQHKRPFFSRERLRRVLRKKTAVVIHQQIYRSTSSHICRSTPSHICRSTSSHIYRSTSSHICRSTSSHIYRSTSSHICRSTSSHICRSTSSHICRSTSLHVCRSLLILSLTVCLPLALLSFSLKAGAVPPDRHETQPFRTKWTSSVQN